jgi:hypothetical protein
MRNDASEPEFAPGEEAVVRVTANPTQAGDWALVLAAAGLPYRLEEREGRFVLTVASGDTPAAAAALAGFDAEAPAKPAPPAPDAGPSALGVLSAVGLGAMYYVSGPADDHSRWIQAGTAVAERIAAGQWWRAVTALTLHADLLHLAGNVVACLIFVAAVGRWLGGGLGALAILLCGAGANLLTAAVHRTAFSSLGASTATFAALGLCAGLQVVRRLRGEMRRAYAWVPLGAGLGSTRCWASGRAPTPTPTSSGWGWARSSARAPRSAISGRRARPRRCCSGPPPSAPSSAPGCWRSTARAERAARTAARR